MTPWSAHLQDGALAIFLFHGVVSRPASPVRNYTRKHLPLDEFAGIIADLTAHGTPLSMPDVVAHTAQGTPWPRRAFAVTFDDGFRNNYALAAPVLADRKVPATFYVTTGFIESNGASWIDLIEFAVERTAAVRLDIAAIGIRGRWVTPAEKRALLDDVRRAVKTDRTIDPYAVVAEIWQQTGVSELEVDPELDQKMTWDEVRALAADPLFTVGGHSHTHRIMEFLPQPELEDEVATSMRLLAANVPGRIDHYSYPEGLAHCYSDRVIELLRRHGIRCAPSAEHGVNAPAADLFRLKRVMVA